uniref:Homocysteine-responsive endoplasmic reticulum-resident ubiquitin-like domain member 2 n=1 Tax=Hadrurus spadix TaxID=141984 RepID=A0A1W7RAE0_9SCOR
MENVNKSVKVLIKTPNQKVNDQSLECLLDWTVNRLKLHISETYPGKPSIEEQKLIYSGRLLHDHLKLKDILRHENEGPHIFHLVCARKDSTAASSLATTINDIENCSQRTTSSQSTVMTSEGIRHRTTSQQANQNFSTTLSMPTFPVSPEQMAQQMIAMQQMYAYYMTQYLQQTQMVATPTTTLEASTATQAPIVNNVANQNIGAPARPVNENVRMNAQGGPLLDDEEEEFRNRDWLDWFYTLSRGLVLLTIVYFYSSPGRFMIVTGIAILAYLYQGGFFGVRQQQNDNENHPEQRQNERANNNEPQLPNRSTSVPPEQQLNQQEVQSDVQQLDNIEDEREQTEQIQDEDNRPFPIVTTAWTFVSSFFSSLIPEQPAPVDIN